MTFPKPSYWLEITTLESWGALHSIDANIRMAIQVTTNKSNDWADREDPKTICLFDVDGTLSLSRKVSHGIRRV